MRVFKKAESYQTCKPGEWCMQGGRVFIRNPKGNGAPAQLTGHMKLAGIEAVPDPERDWKISADGSVHPSVNFILPEDAAFHEFIKLEGWKA